MDKKEDEEPKKTSVAHRTRRICERLLNSPQDWQTWRVWNFALGGQDTTEIQDAILPVIHAMRITTQQLEELRGVLHASNKLNGETINEPIDRLMSIMKSMPRHIDHNWVQIRPSLSADIMQSLVFYDAIVPLSEIDVDAAGLSALLVEVRALRASFYVSGLSSEFREVLISLLSIIEQAIVDSAIEGESAIRSAWGNLFVLAATKKSQPVTEADIEARSQFSRIFQKFKEKTDPIVHASGLLSAFDQGKSLLLLGVKLLTHHQ